MFGYKNPNEFKEYDDIFNAVKEDMFISDELTTELLSKGVFGILFDKFGSSFNSKGYKTLNPQIGVLQGDGISLKTIEKLLIRMYVDKIDTMSLVFGSGGKNLQAHDRDEQKYAIKATHVIVDGNNINVQKKPATDPMKVSKTGYLKLRKFGNTWRDYETISSVDKEKYDETDDFLELVFLNGEIMEKYTVDDIRENAKILECELS